MEQWAIDKLKLRKTSEQMGFIFSVMHLEVYQMQVYEIIERMTVAPLVLLNKLFFCTGRGIREIFFFALIFFFQFDFVTALDATNEQKK
jgi:hypothetical protein